MTGESRAIVRLGLDELARTDHAGLRALLRRSCERPGQPTARDLGFGVVPRINAAGRIADVELAMDAPARGGPDCARRSVAEELERVHDRRRVLTREAVEAASALADATPGVAAPCLATIVGARAGRARRRSPRRYARATRRRGHLVGEEVRGSVRAPVDFHVAAALEACAVHLTKRGGHAAAGGFSLLPESWAAFEGGVRLAPASIPDRCTEERQRPGRQVVDLVLDARATWTGRSLQQLERLAPYGPGHVEPVLAVTGMRVWRRRVASARVSRTCAAPARGLETFDAIAFGVDAVTADSGGRDALDLVGTLERDTSAACLASPAPCPRHRRRAASPLVARRRPARQLAHAG